jgi:hypothetical protein
MPVTPSLGTNREQKRCIILSKPVIISVLGLVLWDNM